MKSRKRHSFRHIELRVFEITALIVLIVTMLRFLANELKALAETFHSLF